MKRANLAVPEIGVIAVTRGMLGAGLGLLLADKVSKEKRKAIGWPLVALGVLSTIPLAVDVVKKTRTP